LFLNRRVPITNGRLSRELEIIAAEACTTLAAFLLAALGERFGFNMGASMYNAFNHANFDLPVSSLSAANFGQIISTAAPAFSPYGAFQGSAVSGRGVVMKAKFDF